MDGCARLGHTFAMNYIHEAICPLCGSQARFKGLDHGRHKHYQCPVCIEFIIEDSSEAKLKAMEQEFRGRHSAHAKGSNATRTWVIREPNDSERKRDKSLTMMGEFVSQLG